MRSLRDALVHEYGLNLDGWSIDYATCISTDGSAIAGIGTSPSGETQGWLAVLPEPCGGASLLLLGGTKAMRRGRRWRGTTTSESVTSDATTGRGG